MVCAHGPALAPRGLSVHTLEVLVKTSKKHKHNSQKNFFSFFLSVSQYLSVGQSVAVSGAISDSQRQPAGFSGSQWQSVAVGGSQWQSVLASAVDVSRC